MTIKNHEKAGVWYKRIFGAIIIGAAIIFGVYKYTHQAYRSGCSYTIYQLSIKKAIPILKNKIELQGEQIQILTDMDDILAKGTAKKQESRKKIMELSLNGVKTGDLDTNQIYKISEEEDRFVSGQTKQALDKLKEFMKSLTPRQKMLLGDKFATFQKECAL